MQNVVRTGARASGVGVMLVALLVSSSAGRQPLHDPLETKIANVTQRLSESSEDRGLLAQLHLERAGYLRRARKFAYARIDLDRAGVLSPQLFEVQLQRSVLLRDMGQPDAALRCVDLYLARGSRTRRALRLRARLLAQLGRHVDALRDYEQLLAHEANPTAEDFVERARLQRALGDTRSALAGLAEGARRLGVAPALEFMALELECERGEFQRALDRIERLAQASARKESWLKRRGDVLLLAGRPADAIAAYKQARAAIARLNPRRRGTRACLARARELDRLLADNRSPKRPK